MPSVEIAPDDVFDVPGIEAITGLRPYTIKKEGQERDVAILGGRQIWTGAQVLQLIDDMFGVAPDAEAEAQDLESEGGEAEDDPDTEDDEQPCDDPDCDQCAEPEEE